MPFERLLAGVAASALLAGSALAQTGGSMAQPSPPTDAGALQPPAGEAPPYAASQTPGEMSSTGVAAFTPLTPMPSASIIATLQASGEFTKLLAALQATNLTGLISTHPNLTLFAPTDAAFAALPPGQLDMLMKSPTQLQAILTYHLVAAAIKDSDIKGHAATKIPTAAKKPITIDGSGPTIMVNDAKVLQAGVAASNGFIYPIDKVLTPAG